MHCRRESNILFYFREMVYLSSEDFQLINMDCLDIVRKRVIPIHFIRFILKFSF